MHIAPGELIAGVSAISLRDVLKRANEEYITAEAFERRLGFSEADAQTLVAALVAEDYLVEHPHFPDAWKLAVRGYALRMASTRRYKRATAEKALEGFRERVGEVNSSERFPYRARKVVLFGSMLDPARDPVGNVDLAVDIVPKDPDADPALQALDHARQAAERGRSFSTMFERLAWPRTEVILHLRSRSPLLNIDPLVDQPAELGANYRVIYEEP